MIRIQPQMLRYLVNGLLATLVHYGVLSLGLGVLGFASAGLANFVAALFGIAASFLGNHCFVFPAAGRPMTAPLVRFAAVYGALAVVHGTALWLWTDRWGADYRIGFLLVTGLQMLVSFLGNKHFVFR